MTKETIPFSFDELYTAVSAKFVDKGYDVQEGSNTMQLVTAMAYLTSMLNTNTAININETLLTLARKRPTVLQDARVLGYEIAHMQSYQYDVNVTFTNTTDAIVTHRIEKYTAFVSGSKTYYYTGPGIDVVLPATSTAPAGTKTSTFNIRVKEGTLKRFTDEATLRLAVQSLTTVIDGVTTTTAQHYVDVPFTSVEENGIEMHITTYDEFGDLQIEEWTRSKQFLIDNDTILNKEFVRLDNIDTSMPRLYFKLGDVGKEVRVGAIVEMNIIVSSGALGEMLVKPTTTLPCVVNSFALYAQGANEETIDSIKINAPLFNNSANRLVTKPDYVAFATRQLAVKYTDVWDGNFELPNRAGYIWFSFVPEALVRTLTNTDGIATKWDLQNPYDFTNWYIEDGEVQSVFTSLDVYKIPTLNFIHRHPVYMDIEYQVKVARYNVNMSRAEVNTLMFKVIDDYYRSADPLALSNPDSDTSAVETYNFEYFQSNLVKRIDRNLSDITGIDLTLIASIPLTSKNIIQEKETSLGSGIYYKQVIFHLGIPFDGIFNPDTSIILNNLPSIDTVAIKGDQTLYTDFTTVVYTGGVRKYPIKLTTQGALGVKDLVNDIIVGEYSVINTLIQDIQITLFVISNNAYSVGFDAADFDLVYTDAPTNTIIDNVNSGIKLSVNYPTPNIPFTRNTIARLRTVEFI